MNARNTVLKPTPRAQTATVKPAQPARASGSVLRPARTPAQLEFQFHRLP